MQWTMPRDKDVKKQRWEGIETRKKSRNVINVGFIEVAANLAATRRVKKKTPGTWLARGTLQCEICHMMCKKASKRKYCERRTGICLQLSLFQFGCFVEHRTYQTTSHIIALHKGEGKIVLGIKHISSPAGSALVGILWWGVFRLKSFVDYFQSDILF